MSTNRSRYLRLENIRKSYRLSNREIHQVLKGVNLDIFYGDKIGIIGINGAGKSTLIRIIGGVSKPDDGTIERNMKVSFPIAFTGGFQESLTGFDNLRFICRVYDKTWEDKVEFVQDFAELGKFFYEPVKAYSAGMRARLGFAISLVVEFDCYLIDEVMAVGDSRFHSKCHEELFIKRQDRSFVIVSHDYNRLEKYCNKFYVLHAGVLTNFKMFKEARDYYEACKNQ